MCLTKCKSYICIWGNQIICLYDIVKIKTMGLYTIYFLSYSLGLFSLADHVHSQSHRGQDRICAKLALRHPAVSVL